MGTRPAGGTLRGLPRSGQKRYPYRKILAHNLACLSGILAWRVDGVAPRYWAAGSSTPRRSFCAKVGRRYPSCNCRYLPVTPFALSSWNPTMPTYTPTRPHAAASWVPTPPALPGQTLRDSPYRKLQEPRAFTPAKLSTPSRSHKRTRSPRTFSPASLSIHLFHLQSFLLLPAIRSSLISIPVQSTIQTPTTLFLQSHTPHIAIMVSVPSSSRANCTLPVPGWALDAQTS